MANAYDATGQNEIDELLASLSQSNSGYHNYYQQEHPLPPPPPLPPRTEQYEEKYYFPENNNETYPFPMPSNAYSRPYPDHSQNYINRSYRPMYSHETDSTTQLSLHSTPTITATTEPEQQIAPTYATTATTKHKRNHSSLRSNMIMTIERPRYDFLPENATSTDGELPFVPVSPDTDSEEEVGGSYFDRYQPVENPPVQSLEIRRQPSVEKLVVEPVKQEPEYALLSVTSQAFIKSVKALENVRELWCASEYNESFTGSEAVTIMKALFKDRFKDEYYVGIANSLMHTDPPVFSPTQYSQRSLISKIMYNSEDTYFVEEDASDGALPTGVFTPMTRCYSYSCVPGKGGCYSPLCPNLNLDLGSDYKTDSGISRETSIKSPVQDGLLVPNVAWSSRVDESLLKATDKKEIARQEIINEIIYSEEKFLSDLTVLKEVIVDGLNGSNAIEKTRRQEFLQIVFNNYEELIVISRDLFKDLLDLHYRYDRQCVPMIGDILVQHIAFFEKPFVTYSPHAPLAKYIAETEIKNNPEFERFVKDIANHSRTNRLPFWNYLLCPVTRMQRYPLLISTLLKKTPEEHPDYTYLTRCYDMIRQVAKKADNATAPVKRQLGILAVRDAITFKQGELIDLQLGDMTRTLYHRGILRRRNTTEAADKHDIYVFVFDHMVVMTKMRKTSTGEEYRLWRRPIPLHLLTIQNSSTGIKPQLSGTATNYAFPGGSATIALQHLGQKDGLFPFYCSSLEEKQVWVKAIEDAKTSLRKRLGDSDVFELRPLDDINFRYFGPSTTSARIHCSVPFTTSQGERKIAIGTDNGVFLKTENQDSSVRRIIQTETVIQLAVMEKHHILIVLTEKALRAYPLDMLCSNTNTKAIDKLEVEIAQNVGFFQIGYCNNRDMLVFKKKKNTASVFTALEPICDLSNPKNEKLLTRSTSLFSTRPEYLKWFKKYKEFYVGADATNIHFLKTKLNVVCERGFEIIDPENLHSGRDIPDSEDPQFNFVTRHSESLKPLAMYRVHDRFLLCYSKFAFCVNNRNGSLVVHGAAKLPTLCEWEGSPNNIVYHWPYIIAIDSQFIEIRNVDNGELVQIIAGENIRLSYYNATSDRPVVHICMTHSQKPDTQALYHLFLTNNRNSTGGYPRR